MSSFNDPNFPSQWQLGPGTGINATPLYEEYTGEGVRIGLVDTGLDYANPDFSGQVDLQNDYDALEHDNDANNVGGDQHGTEVGLILAAAANNGVDRVGAAFGATLFPYRFDTRSLRTLEQETTLLQQQDKLDISHNSWSRSGEFFRDNFGNPEYAVAAMAIAHAAAVGRGGLGTIIVRSAGNNGDAGDDVNSHNYMNNRYSIAVGATAQDGTVQNFSNTGAALTVVAPGTATSWAAPLASATAALMLQANPKLGYRDVATILSITAKVTDPTGAGWFTNASSGWNGGGLHVSGKAGFGLIDAQAAVRLAETWTTQSTEANLLQVKGDGLGTAAIPDQGNTSQTVQIGENLRVERAEVDIDIAHDKIGDLRLVLVSPSGTESVLLDRLGKGTYDASDGKLAFTLSSNQFLWENSRGSWTLLVEDVAMGNTGTLQDWTLRLYGSQSSDDSLYVYTNEYASLWDLNAARGVLSDVSGHDTINAAAVSSASIINLSAGTISQIAGRPLKIANGTVIEDGVAGDGADLIIGNRGANRLSGMRGDDTLWGGAGNDLLTGGKEQDAFVFNARLGTSKTDRKVNFDKIADFNVKDDTIWLDNAIFKKLGKGSEIKPGKLNKSYFESGQADDRNDYLLYNKNTGILSYDADGSGAKAAVEFAQLGKNLKLTYKDFFII
ncbi:S8 family serine peptidase [Microvirga sp. 3-52]|nr:S8 family serine peptidase [Microvirga sp. 3-52]